MSTTDDRTVSTTDGDLTAELLAIAREQAVGAGKLLAEKYRSGIEEGVRSKSTPTDLVSDADIEAERLIREGIERARPGDGILGEEGDDRVGESGLRWVVDPLDGTINYLFGIPQWCVSVAVQDDELTGGVGTGLRTGGEGTGGEEAGGEEARDEEADDEGERGEGLRSCAGTLAGAVYDPLRDELFAAANDEEATLNGEPIAASKCADLAKAMVATGFNYDANVRKAQAKVLVDVIPRVRDIRRFGAAALDLAWTAMGRYDAFYERGVHVWDVAAGVLVCERAGLQVRELPAQEGLPGDGRLPWGVLVAPPALMDDLMEMVCG